MVISSATVRTRSKEIYEVIKSRILSQELKPGQHVSERALAKELGVARATLRESLVHLANDDFIEKMPGVGSFVKNHRTEEVAEHLEVRQVLEGHAARRAAENITASQAKELETLVARLETAFQNGDDDSLNQLDIDLHMKIVDSNGNSALKEMIRQSQNVKYLLLREYTSEKTDYSAAVLEHKKIVAAIVEGNSEDAETLMKNHLSKGIDRFWVSMRQKATP